MMLGEALLHALKDHGAREVFGIPGDFALPFFKVMEESRILPLYTVSHEPAVGFAADAAARFNSALGVAAVTYGAGAFNMVNAVSGAYAEKSPVVVISAVPGAAEARSGLLLHHQGKTLDSQFHVYTEITCDQAVLDDAARAPADIARVLRSCRERSRPVYIELPRDMVAAECGPVTSAPPSPADDEAVAACAEEILGRLGRARSPVVMAGVELRRYRLEAKVAQLARRLGLPVATSFMGRGLLTAPEAPLIGTYMGVAGDPEVTETVESSDALLLLGVILSDTNFGVSARHINMRRVIAAADREVRLGFHIYPNVPLADLIDALLARVEDRRETPPWPRTPAPRGLRADEAPIQPIDVAIAVNDMFDAQGTMPIASDVGDCLFTAMDILQTPMVAPGYYATMGFGIPALFDTGQQGVDQLGQRHIGIDMEVQAHLPVGGGDDAAHVDVARRDAEVGIGQDDAEQQQGVRVLHHLRHLGVAGHTHVGADQRRLGGGEKATSHEAGRHRQAEAARKLRYLGFQAVPAQLDAGHHHRRPRPAEAVEDLLGAGGHRLVVHRRRGRGGDGTALGGHHVPGQLDVDGPRPLAATAQYPGDIGGRPGRIVEHRLVAGDLGVDAELGVQRLALVMEE